MKKFLKIITAVCLSTPMASAWDWNNNADIRFWAPGMGGNYIHLTQVQGGGPGPQFIGNYYLYVIKGISGSLTLGNRNLHDEYSQTGPNQRPWSTTNSWATLGFGINHKNRTESALYLSVTGTEAGATTGTVTQLLPTPVVIKSRGKWDTSITFIPHVNPYFLPSGSGLSNKTPGGGITVLADIYTRPPEPTGELDTSSRSVFRGEPVTVFYNYDQGEDALRASSTSKGGSAPTGVLGGGQR